MIVLIVKAACAATPCASAVDCLPPSRQTTKNAEGTIMLFAGAPNALHYAWEAKVPGFDWAFDKHQHKDFKAEKCPPWDLKSRQEGLFPHPPSPSELTSKVCCSLLS
jgi:hypothetical protein